eukprot:1287443-Rhodomonas_salina.1
MVSRMSVPDIAKQTCSTIEGGEMNPLLDNEISLVAAYAMSVPDSAQDTRRLRLIIGHPVSVPDIA